VVAAQLAVVPAFAQTSATTTGTSGLNAASSTFGHDWSTTLGLAMFGDGESTLRSESELTSQWETLSDEDKDMIRRDCMMHMQQSGGMTGSTGTTGSTSSSTGTTTGGASGTAAGTPMTGSNPAINVSMEQMETICDATRDRSGHGQTRSSAPASTSIPRSVVTYLDPKRKRSACPHLK
jgi:hypothetical protein